MRTGNTKIYEMAFTPVEFDKTLHGQFTQSGIPYSCEDISSLHWRVSDKGETTIVDIRISEAPPRKMAMLTLPVLNVQLEFSNTNDEQQDNFLTAFFKYFHKGGG